MVQLPPFMNKRRTASLSHKMPRSACSSPSLQPRSSRIRCWSRHSVVLCSPLRPAAARL
jgi:hypothetical protein